MLKLETQWLCVKLNVEETKLNLPELIADAVNGEEIVIVKDDQHIVKLVPALHE